jgi:hypothetical protein
MKTRTLSSTLALLAALTLATSCSDPAAPAGGGPKEELPTTYPPIPRPSTPDETIPDESEIYTAIASITGKQIDFAPVWSAGEFTWNIDIQTQYDQVFGGWTGDAPGEYWNGTRQNSGLTFENGIVDLRNPTAFGTSSGDPHPRRNFDRRGRERVRPRCRLRGRVPRDACAAGGLGALKELTTDSTENTGNTYQEVLIACCIIVILGF